MKKLVEYRNKAKMTTIGTAVGGGAFLGIYALAASEAQSSYYETLTDLSLSSDYAMDLATRTLASDMASANALAAIGAFLVGVAGMALMLWMLANLLIAYKTPDDDVALASGEAAERGADKEGVSA